MDINNKIFNTMFGEDNIKKTSDIWAFMSAHYLLTTLGHKDEREFGFQLTSRGMLCLKCLTKVSQDQPSLSAESQKLLVAIKNGCQMTKNIYKNVGTKNILISAAGYRFIKNQYPNFNDEYIKPIFYQNLPNGNFEAGRDAWRNIQNLISEKTTQTQEL